MPVFTFVNSSVVAVGTFNIYVLQPDNLKKMGALDTNKKVLVMGDLSAPGVRFEEGNVKWVVRPDRVSVETESKEVNVGAKLGKVIENLSWTPIIALGMNITFRGDRSATVDGQLRLQDVANSKQVSTHVAFDFHDGVLNIQLARTPEFLELAMNAHFDLSKFRPNIEELIKIAVEKCQSFIAFREEMTGIAKSLTNIELI